MSGISTIITHLLLYSWTDGDNRVYVYPAHAAPVPTTAPWLFFRPAYLGQTSVTIYSFILISDKNNGISAVFHCAPERDHWTSIPHAPFGGIWICQPCDRHQLAFLLSCVRDWVSRHGGNALLIKTPPSCYAPSGHELCHHAYLDAGFLPNHTYSNHYIPMGEGHFGHIIEPAERRRLSKGKKSGLIVTAKAGICADTMKLLARCRLAHGYAAEGDLRCTGDNPEDYLTLICHHESRQVAAAVMVRVSHEILYHYRSGYLPEYGAFSPSLMLFEAAYAYAQQHRMKLLDLGISVDHQGEEKPSLSRFKARIGGLECKKMIYKAAF